MIRISRLIYAPEVVSILALEGVSKIEITQGKNRNFEKPIARVYIYLYPNCEYFNGNITNLIDWGMKNNNNRAKTTGNQALKDGFVKETAFEEIGFPMPKKYQELCTKYSQEFFNQYGELALARQNE